MRIFQLQHEDQIIEGDDALKQHITKYYKNLFGPSEMNTFSLDESRIDDIPQVTELENEQLIKPFSEEEVRHAGSRSRWIPCRVLSGMLEYHQRGSDGTVFRFP
jgi:hypothetical protein